MSIYFHQLTSLDIKEASDRNTLILLPVGQVEEHGPHLPLECDCIIARETAKAVAEEIVSEIPVLVMPTVWTAYSVRQVAHWPGLITFREPEPMIQMIYDILASLVENGFQKIVIVNAHGNNPAILELACRRIGSDYNVFPAVTYVLSMSAAIGPLVRKSEMGGCGGHAGEEETALLLHLTPELVHMDRATDKDIVRYHTRFFPGDIYSDIPNRLSRVFWSTWGVVQSETGVYGDPTAATAETGKALFGEIVENYKEFLREYYAHGISCISRHGNGTEIEL
jgi:creatinine amidohydrolase